MQGLQGKNVVVNLTWKPPSVQGVAGLDRYRIYRVDGSTLTLDNFAKRVFVGKTETTQITDAKVITGKTYAYFVIAVFNGTLTEPQAFSGKSNIASILVTK